MRESIRFDLAAVRRVIRAVAGFLNSEVRWRARALFAVLLVFAITVNGLNVVSSYVGRDFMTAIADRDRPSFVRQAVLYLCVFALTTLVAVFYRFTEERLGLFWRAWMTRGLARRYLQDRTFLWLKESAAVDNPDQRIADDVRAFTTTALSFTLMSLNGALAVISFSGVLWSISPRLFLVAVGYAAAGTFLAIFLGLPLIRLNYRQFDQEANFRADLIHIRENAESVALLRREGRLTARLMRRIDELVENFRRITRVNRNLGFFTTAYNYLIPVIPTLIVAPLYFRGQVEFGVITQSAVAFAQLVGAFSLIINQFQSLSSFAAEIARLNALIEAVEQGPPHDGVMVEMVPSEDCLAFERLTLLAPDDRRMLVDQLSARVPRRSGLLVVGPNEAVLVAIFRATAGFWPLGQGRLLRPPLDAVLFLPQRPYLPPGTLREALLRTGLDSRFSDEEIASALHAEGLESILHRSGGLDVEHDWQSMLSLGEQQQLALTRLILTQPAFAMLDRIDAALNPTQVRHALRRLREKGIAYISLAEVPHDVDLFDTVLKIHPDGSWSRQSPTVDIALGEGRPTEI